MPWPPVDATLAALLATVLVAGLVRGFAGFGTGMIVMPVASALYDPRVAVVLILVIDLLPVVPVTIPAFRIARWREILPVLAGMAALVPLGVQVLRLGEATALRWLICLAALAAVAALASGWRYRGVRSVPLSFGVGALGGFLGGVAGIPGPPPILYWMASPLPAAIVRANMLVLLLLVELLAGANLWLVGLVTASSVALGLVAAPVYFAGILVGWACFGLASERFYRRLAFVVIVMAALGALPVFDGLTR